MATRKKATRKKISSSDVAAKPPASQDDNPTTDSVCLAPRFWKVILTACAMTVLLEILMQFHALGSAHRHPHFQFEDGNPMSDSVLAAFSNWFGFYGIYGILACVGSVLLAKGLSVFLKAREDYYDGTP
tara:strand:- start:502 stop:888 length:387 start_codon:yes stop_codon:yes gene_type:complete